MTVFAATTVLGVFVGIGVAASLLCVFGVDRSAPVASLAGWIGLVGGAVALYAGQGSFEPAPVPTAFLMAASAALAILPAAGDSGAARFAGALASTLVGGGLGSAALVFASSSPPTPWSEGAILIGVHWAALGAAATTALAGVLLVAGWVFRIVRSSDAEGAEKEAFRLRAGARDAAARGVALIWLAWPLARMIHWRFLGTPGVGSRSEWFGLGITLVATGALLVGWDLDESRSARLRSAAGPVAVAAAIITGVWIAFGFGSPFALSLGS